MLNAIAKPQRIFLLSWMTITAVLVLFTLAVHLGQNAMIGALGARVADEFAASPQMQMQIQQARQQGMRPEQIQSQLQRMGEQRAADMVENAKSALRWATVLAVLACVLFHTIIARHDVHSQTKRYAAYAVAALLLLQLLNVALKYVQVENTDQTLGEPEVVRRLKEAPAPFRIAVVDVDQRNPVYNLWLTTVFGLHGLECINVPADSRPTPDRVKFFYSPALSPLRRWEYANVQYLLGTRQGLESRLQMLGARDQFAPWFAFKLNEEDHAVYAFTNTLPRVFAVGTWIVETNADAVLAFMDTPSNNPHAVAVVNNAEITAANHEAFVAAVNITSYVPERIAATVQLSATGLVVLTTEPAPGWHATVDGVPQPIVRCNLLQQGIIVPAGAHEVVFTYATRDWMTSWNNGSLMLVPILALATLGIVLWQRRHGRPIG